MTTREAFIYKYYTIKEHGRLLRAHGVTDPHRLSCSELAATVERLFKLEGTIRRLARI
jgi:hypothetical protein